MSDPALAERRLTEIAALERPAEAKRMLVIVNPYATTMSVRLKNLVVYALQGRYEVEAIETERRGHATELCVAAAEEQFDVVVAFGGDGTVNEVANGLAGTGTPLTVLPGGSNNVFAKMLSIPNDVVDATENLLGLADRWEPRAVDRQLALGAAARSRAGREDDGVRPLDRLGYLIRAGGLEVDQDRLGSVGAQVVDVLALADQPEDGVAARHQQPRQAARHLPVPACDRYVHAQSHPRRRK